MASYPPFSNISAASISHSMLRIRWQAITNRYCARPYFVTNYFTTSTWTAKVYKVGRKRSAHIIKLGVWDKKYVLCHIDLGKWSHLHGAVERFGLWTFYRTSHKARRASGVGQARRTSKLRPHIICLVSTPSNSAIPREVEKVRATPFRGLQGGMMLPLAPSPRIFVLSLGRMNFNPAVISRQCPRGEGAATITFSGIQKSDPWVQSSW